MLCVAAVAAGSAGAATSKSAFEVFVEPTISAASNGLTLETELEGTFNVADKTASGSGPYAVTFGSTVAESGTFELTRLVAFQFYGCGEVEGTELPSDFCGGRAIFRFHATSSTGEVTTGLYEVNCQIHDPGGKTPPGDERGRQGERARDQLQQTCHGRQPVRDAALGSSPTALQRHGRSEHGRSRSAPAHDGQRGKSPPWTDDGRRTGAPDRSLDQGDPPVRGAGPCLLGRPQRGQLPAVRRVGLWWAQVVSSLRSLGLTIKEIDELAGVYLSRPDEPIGPHLAALLGRAEQRIDQRVAELEDVRRRIQSYRAEHAAALAGRPGADLMPQDPRRQQTA